MFSAPMNWNDLLKQLQEMEKDEALVSLPIVGAVLAARVRLVITSGLTDLSKLLRQATVRRNIVVQLIRMQRDAGHPDFQKVDMRNVASRAKELAPSDDATIPNGIAHFFDGEEDEDVPFLGVDKPATPAERTRNAADLEKDLQRARPLVLAAQRDSDVNKDIENSRVNAFAEFSQLELCTGSTLEPQFQTDYIPRVFSLTLPWCVGGPDFPRQPRRRRCFADAPALSLDAFTTMIAARCESAI